MKVIQRTTSVLIGVFLAVLACARPTSPVMPVTPVTPPTPPPTTPPTITLPPTPPVVQGPYDVWINGRDFNPSILKVPVGTKVTWTNRDGEQHTITSNTGLFGPNLAFLQSFSYTFTVRGSFEYHCDPHPDMTAVVIVE